MAMADKRSLDAEIRLESDILILDYLVYTATCGLLKTTSQRLQTANKRIADIPEELIVQLQLVDSFLTIFKSAHATTTSLHPHGLTSPSISPTLRFRLQLLRFITLFVFRETHNTTTPSAAALHSLRIRNRRRAETWHARIGVREPQRNSASARAPPTTIHDEPGVVDELDTFKNLSRDEVAKPIHIDLTSSSPPAQNNAHQTCPLPQPLLLTLLDILPAFIALTATRAHFATPATTSSSPSPNISNWAPTTRWLELVAEMMLQAVLEAVLIHDMPLEDAVMEAFAWGTTLSLGGYDRPAVNEGRERDVEMIDIGCCGVPDRRIEPGEGEVDGTDEKHSDNVFILRTETAPTASSSSIKAPTQTPGAAWHALRFTYKDQLTPPPLMQITNHDSHTPHRHEHLQTLSTSHPLPVFTTQILSFLNALHNGLEEEPVLAILEQELGGDGLELDGGKRWEDVERVLEGLN